MKTVKLTSTKYYDELPSVGNEYGQAFRDKALEEKLLNYTRKMGYGAQFGGKYFALDVRVVRLPRHGASCPVGIGVSCSADRNAKGRIDKDGVWLEKLEDNPGRFIPESAELSKPKESVKIDLNRPMVDILAELSKYPVTTPLSLSGTIVVARDSAHAKLQQRIDRGEGLPEYIKNHPVYYAGPAKTPAGKPSGSFGPTTAGRMDSYVAPFQAEGGSMIMLAKGNRSQQVTDACQKFGGFYLGSIGGPAALLAEYNIKQVEVLEYPELGMEAVWKIEVEDFPAYILVDDKGNDFFASIRETCAKCAVQAFKSAKAENA
jgi:fumarate hydratase, class I